METVRTKDQQGMRVFRDSSVYRPPPFWLTVAMVQSVSDTVPGP